MGKSFNWQIAMGIALVLLSFVFYLLHYFLFRDLHHIFLYLIGDIAFVFIEVLLVTLIIHRLLSDQEKKSHLKKLNMVIEVFFSEYGKYLLSYLARFDGNVSVLRNAIIDPGGECKIDFRKVHRTMKNYSPEMRIENIDLAMLCAFLKTRRGHLVSLLQNPNLLEHQSFTEMIMSIFHITEELVARDLASLSADDLAHTKEDIERVYSHLTRQWISYMRYTEENYPYFFLYAIRTNPFDENAPWLKRLSESGGIA